MSLLFISNQTAPILQSQNDANHIWILIATGLVLFMQAGFLLLEAGITRSKNSISVAQKNLADLCVSVCAFFLVGFGLMFGPSLGWFGWAPKTTLTMTESWPLIFFSFQAVFAGTAATIMSGAVAERMRFGAYLIMAALLAGLFYPLFGHWAWGNLLDPTNPAWLADRGFMDFAGSSVVHAAGGWFALGVIIVLGPRVGRFGPNGKPVAMNGHSLVLSAAGAVILLFGWFGFNAGSTVSADASVAAILANTLIAAVFGGAAGMLIGRVIDGFFLPHRGINGLLGGLVGITAGCAFVDLQGAMAIGVICGLVASLSEAALLRFAKLDDVVGAVAVHGVCGAAGTLLLAFFAPIDVLAAGGRMAQISIQLQGVAINFALFFGAGFLIALVLNKMGLLRIPHEDEMRGLNISEHGVTMSTGALQEALARITMVDRDLTKRLDNTGGDDGAEIAGIINPFLVEMQRTLQNVREHAGEVNKASESLLILSQDCATQSGQLSDTSRQMLGSAQALTTGADQASQVVTQVRMQADNLAEKSSTLASQMADLTLTVRNMSLTIKEISSDAQGAKTATQTALKTSTESLEKIGTLAETTEAVEEVLTQIREIADKTILLSLNARVEAARSGSAGRGFAIVAQEVAELSHRTQTAAGTITERIAHMKAGSLDALEGMRTVGSVLRDLSQDMSRVSDATTQQDAAIEQLESVAETGSQLADNLNSDISALRDGTNKIAQFTDSVRRDSAQSQDLASDLQAGAERGKSNAEDIAQSSTNLAKDSEHLNAAARRYRA
ncbi:MAG: ammonium transporter [Pelagimonas sp.]|uniref:ammonium transporter n=1 Tax=Pelagimonas sp. TaxID=2073170 RepID=UPI003D6ACC96